VGGVHHGPDEFVTVVLPQLAAAIDFASMRLESISADGDRVAALLSARTAHGCEIRISEHWQVHAGALRQLRVFYDDTSEWQDTALSDAADRLAIRELVDAYAYCADRRDAAGQLALFTEDTDFAVYMNSRDPLPTQHLRGSAALAPVFNELNSHETTMHFNGQSTVAIDGQHASAVTYCMAHHVTVDDFGRTLMVASIRYLATFVKHNGAWLFSQRKLLVDSIETRPLGTQ
jgi:SnoaL-like domain